MAQLSQRRWEIVHGGPKIRSAADTGGASHVSNRSSGSGSYCSGGMRLSSPLLAGSCEQLLDASAEDPRARRWPSKGGQMWRQGGWLGPLQSPRSWTHWGVEGEGGTWGWANGNAPANFLFIVPLVRRRGCFAAMTQRARNLDWTGAHPELRQPSSVLTLHSVPRRSPHRERDGTEWAAVNTQKEGSHKRGTAGPSS